MDFSYSRPPFLTFFQVFPIKIFIFVKNGRSGIWKIHVLKWYKRYNQWLWVSYAPLIKWEALYPRLSIFYGWPKSQHLAHFYEKKSSKSKKLHFFIRNMVYYGCACIVSCIIPIRKWSNPQIHIYHLKPLYFLKFLTLRTFFHRNEPSVAVLATHKK